MGSYNLDRTSGIRAQIQKALDLQEVLSILWTDEKSIAIYW
ncbi:MAG: hypothetical protein CH104c_0489 [Candidatus Woesebacteria bacterium]|nr:MAG: hypothetical protein CH104c_0489 [Candidatus Woesebacteria bacterium]